MKIKELEAILEERIPSSLRCDWDNDGRMLLSDGERRVERILIALDATPDVVAYAIRERYDLILTHHPFLFRPLSRIDNPMHIELIRNGISVFSYHTRLDAVSGGVNDALAMRLSLTELSAFGEEDMGRVGTLPWEMSLSELVAYVKERIGAPRITALDAGRSIKRLAILGGSGKDFISDAARSGADAFLTGEASYNALLDATGLDMSILLAGHFYTEQPVCERLKELVSEACPDCEITVWNATRLMEY